MGNLIHYLIDVIDCIFNSYSVKVTRDEIHSSYHEIIAFDLMLRQMR